MHIHTFYTFLIIVSVLVQTLPFIFADSIRTVSRKPYAIRVVSAISLIALTCAVGVAANLNEPNFVSAGIFAWFIVVEVWILGYMVALWSIYRLRDAGRSVWWGLLLPIPGVNVAAWVTLSFLPSRTGEGERPKTLVS